MSYKSENWKEKLEEVRMHVALKEGSVEKSADDILSDQIDEELATFFVEDTEELVLEASSGEMIKKVFNTKSETEALGIAKLLSMTDVKVALGMQKQNPDGFKKTTFSMGADNKNRNMASQKELEKMFKKAGVKPLPEETVEEVKEEKLSVERTITKLTEKNMLGRLSKSLRLDEEGKEKLFNYFDKGELEQ
tara:strand:+ start:262 stop:837 length:576 start_codon:yes stop_codon:yes gene_type:complete